MPETRLKNSIIFIDRVRQQLFGGGEMSSKKILAASIGNCVHVAGVYHFLQLAEREDYECTFIVNFAR